MLASQMIHKSSFVLTSIGIFSLVVACQADEFDQFVKPLLVKNCVRCHGGDEVNGKVNFKELQTSRHFLDQPKLIKEVIEVIDANDMPPEDEPQLEETERTKLLATLKTMLRKATAGNEARPNQIRRLNRFQYNNSVKDLFQLKVDVFKLE